MSLVAVPPCALACCEGDLFPPSKFRMAFYSWYMCRFCDASFLLLLLPAFLFLWGYSSISSASFFLLSLLSSIASGISGRFATSCIMSVFRHSWCTPSPLFGLLVAVGHVPLWRCSSVPTAHVVSFSGLSSLYVVSGGSSRCPLSV